jgi:hypothetical protein
LVGILVAFGGVCLMIAGLVMGGPDVVGGIVFGGVFVLAGAVICWRRNRV